MLSGYFFAKQLYFIFLKLSIMKCYLYILSFLLLFSPISIQAIPKAPSDTLPVRGLSIKAPTHEQLPLFIHYIKKELVPRKVNTLILLVDYGYQFKTHPELVDSGALSEDDARKIAQICKANHINLIPQINLMGHQSWQSKLGKLLEVYPEFDETPWIKMPTNYEWPNDDNLYCKSYCPLAPGLHRVLFDIIDEVCDAFEAKAFHAGMDEVFYIGMPKCPRCGGKDPARLFADEVRRIDNHLKSKGRQMWMWGDRFLDGKTTGLGEWEASKNNTYRAIDMVPKDIVICDWHYENPAQTAVYFASKGFQVVTCPWRKPQVGIQQVEDQYRFRRHSNKTMKKRYLGIIQTVWTDNPISFFQNIPTEKTEKESASNSFFQIFQAINKHLF